MKYDVIDMLTIMYYILTGLALLLVMFGLRSPIVLTFAALGTGSYLHICYTNCVRVLRSCDGY